MPTVPEQYQHLVDDAAVFPPGNAPLADAVTAHDGHSSAEYADLVGPFVVDDVRLPRLGELTEGRTEPLPVTVSLSGTSVPFPPGAFLQPTEDGEAALVAAVRDCIGDSRAVADLATLGLVKISREAQVSTE